MILMKLSNGIIKLFIIINILDIISTIIGLKIQLYEYNPFFQILNTHYYFGIFLMCIAKIILIFIFYIFLTVSFKISKKYAYFNSFIALSFLFAIVLNNFYLIINQLT